MPATDDTLTDRKLTATLAAWLDLTPSQARRAWLWDHALFASDSQPPLAAQTETDTVWTPDADLVFGTVGLAGQSVFDWAIASPGNMAEQLFDWIEPLISAARLDNPEYFGYSIS